jgi:uncharacterized integral membrane protein
MADTADGQGRASKAPTSFYSKLARPRVIVGAVALVLAIIFIAENNEKVRIHFIFFTVHSRLWVGFLVSLVLGALLGQALLSFWRRRQSRPPDHAAQRDERSAA